MKKLFVRCTALFALLLIASFYGCGTKTPAPKPLATPAPEVAILSVAPTAVARELTLPGRVTPVRQAEVRPQVSGIITARLFDEGAEVKKGQPLYQIDATRYQALFNSAQAELLSAQTDTESAKARVTRNAELLKTQGISQQVYDDTQAAFNKAKAAVLVAQAKLELARIDLDYTKVYAPIAGHISRSFVSEGALVTTNQSQQLAVITQLNPIYVDIQHTHGSDPSLTAQLAQGAPIEVHLLRDNGSLFPDVGTLKFAEVTQSETTASTLLRAQFPSPLGQFLPGMFVRTRLTLSLQNVILAPQRATTRTPNGTLSAWVVDNQNTAQTRTIEVNGTHNDNWIVSSGLNTGDRLIVEGYQKVRPGQVVTTIPWQASNVPSPVTKPVTKPATKPVTTGTTNTPAAGE